MNKGDKNQRFLCYNFFPKNSRGQFYLILTIIIITAIAGLASVTNFVEKKGDTRFYYAKDELEFESEKVIDYGIAQNFNANLMKELMINFANDYSAYSRAENLYFIFGNSGGLTFTGIKKTADGTVNVDFQEYGTGTEVTMSKGVFSKREGIEVSASSGSITIDGIVYPFNIHQGEDFYFVVSKELEGDVYTITNG